MPRAATVLPVPAIVLALVLALAGCGGDDDGAGGDGTGVTAASTTSTTAASTTAAAQPDDTAAGELPAACDLVPADDVNAATGLSLADGEEIGNELRAVCAFSATSSGGVGVTVGVEATGRFDEKAQSSQDALDDEPEELAGVGDRALVFYGDEDFPEGLGGVLVGIGDDLTIDITVQGAGDEATTSAAAVAIAELAVANLE